MTNRQKWAALFLVALFAIVGGAQQQYSGGNAVTQSGSWNVGVTGALPAGSNVIGHVIADSGSTTAVTSLPSLPTGANAIGSITNSAFALNAGTAKIGVVYPYTSCGTTAFTVALQAMPTSSTAVASSTTCPLSIVVSNTTAGVLTYTISDNQGTPINFVSAISINAGERDVYAFPNGAKFTSGIKVQASGAGITYAIEGLQ